MDRRNAIEARASRLKQARERAGYDSPRKAAKAFGWNENTYRAHERGANGFENDVGEEYAAKFKVDLGWLMIGRGEDRQWPTNAHVQIKGVVGTHRDGRITPLTKDTPATVEIPLSLGDAWEALYVGGKELEPYRKPGMVLLYRPVIYDPSTLSGHECVIELLDGRRFLLYLWPDEKAPGRWSLESDFELPMQNQELRFYAPIRFVQIWQPPSSVDTAQGHTVDS